MGTLPPLALFGHCTICSNKELSSFHKPCDRIILFSRSLNHNMVSEVGFEACPHSCQITSGATVNITLEDGDRSENDIHLLQPGGLNVEKLRAELEQQLQIWSHPAANTDASWEEVRLYY